MYSLVSFLAQAHAKLQAKNFSTANTPICAHFARWQRRLPKEACAPARKTKGKASKSTSIKIAEEEEAGLEKEA